MTTAALRSSLRCAAILAVLLLAVTQRLSAQAEATAPKATIEELTAQWASLEMPLLGVPNLTDLQRDAIELLEEKYRKLFNDEAGPIRAPAICDAGPMNAAMTAPMASDRVGILNA